MTISRNLLPIIESCFALLLSSLAGCGWLEPDRNQPLVFISLFETAPSEMRERLEKISSGVQVRSAELQRAFRQREEQRISEHNRRVAEQFAVIQQSGGLRATIEKQAGYIRAEIPKAAPGDRVTLENQVASLQRLLEITAFCTTPLIFDVTGLSHAGKTSDWVVQPRGSIYITGCHLGDRASGRPQVKLILQAPDTPEVTLDVRNWADDGIEAFMPDLSGVVDQPATLIVTTASGRAAPPLEVSFIAAREWTYVDPVKHPGTLFVDCGHNTTTDKCSAYAHNTSPPTLYLAGVGEHFTFCCSSVSGTDRWELSLKNGWMLMGLNAPAIDPGTSDPQGPQVSNSFVAYGYTTCNFFNRDGKVTDYRQFASTDPRLQGGVLEISWWVDHSCSGIQYGANLSIVGPVGIPYW